MNEETRLIGRKDAADYLEISTRTLDRYAKSGRLNTMRKMGNILYYEKELREMKMKRNVHTPSLDRSPILPTVQGEKYGEDGHEYKILWERSRGDLEKKDRIIHELHHRLGYLESELKHSVPLLESESSKKNMEDSIAYFKKRLHRMKIGKMLFMALFIISLLSSFLFFLVQSGVLTSRP